MTSASNVANAVRVGGDKVGETQSESVDAGLGVRVEVWVLVGEKVCEVVAEGGIGVRLGLGVEVRMNEGDNSKTTVGIADWHAARKRNRMTMRKMTRFMEIF